MDSLGSRLSISVDPTTERMVREISEQSAVSMSQVLKDAVQDYLLRPDPRRVHVAASRTVVGRELGRGAGSGRAPSLGGETFPYTPPEDRGSEEQPEPTGRRRQQRLSFSLSPQLRTALQERRDRETRSVSDIVRTALDFYLFDIIRRVSLADFARADDGRPLTEVTSTFD